MQYTSIFLPKSSLITPTSLQYNFLSHLKIWKKAHGVQLGLSDFGSWNLPLEWLMDPVKLEKLIFLLLEHVKSEYFVGYNCFLMFCKIFPGTKEKVFFLCVIYYYMIHLVYEIKIFLWKGFNFFLDNKLFSEITQKFILRLGKTSIR